MISGPSFDRRWKVWLLAGILLAPGAAFGKSPIGPPPLGPATGRVVKVSNEPQLQAAMQGLTSKTTILIAPGLYRLTNTLALNGTFSDVVIRGATDNANDVTLAGLGMTNAASGNTRYGIWTGGNVQRLTIANMTIRDFSDHSIVFNAGTQTPHVYNVHLIDAGKQFIKSNPDDAGHGVDNGVVEYSVIEYTSTAKDFYTNGIDVHTGNNWIIRHNYFRNIVSPAGQLAGPAVLVWNHASNTLTEGNTFVNCARGIAYGLEDRPGTDHSGGIIRNNFIYRASTQRGDVGIMVADSPDTKVLNNTVILSGTYPAAIEYRFAETRGTLIQNNLVDAAIQARDGATGATRTNVTTATPSMFLKAAIGDLHIVASAKEAIGRGTATGDVLDDWDGQIRPGATVPDVGADQLMPSTAGTGDSSGSVQSRARSVTP